MTLLGRKSPVKLALAFVEACNARDAAALTRLVREDFVFRDSRGGTIHGRRAMLDALAQVNAVAPDLRVQIATASRRGDTALLSGKSITANPDIACDTQWRAVAQDGMLVSWEAFGERADSSLVGLLGFARQPE